jgi:hypothetical protein
MHLTLVVAPAALHAGVWDAARSVASARVPLRTMGVRVVSPTFPSPPLPFSSVVCALPRCARASLTQPPLDLHTLVAALEDALAQLAGVDLTAVAAVSGAAYPALVGDGVADAFTPQADGVPLTKWMERSLGDEGGTAPRWRAWGLNCRVLPCESASSL